jgi:hypothetical protein
MASLDSGRIDVSVTLRKACRFSFPVSRRDDLALRRCYTRVPRVGMQCSASTPRQPHRPKVEEVSRQASNLAPREAHHNVVLTVVEHSVPLLLIQSGEKCFLLLASLLLEGGNMTIRFKPDDRVKFFLRRRAADKIQIDERIGAMTRVQQRCGQACDDFREIETARAASLELLDAQIKDDAACPNTQTFATIVVA